jgi:hypothetical protein
MVGMATTTGGQAAAPPPPPPSMPMPVRQVCVSTCTQCVIASPCIWGGGICVCVCMCVCGWGVCSRCVLCPCRWRGRVCLHRRLCLRLCLCLWAQRPCRQLPHRPFESFPACLPRRRRPLPLPPPRCLQALACPCPRGMPCRAPRGHRRRPLLSLLRLPLLPLLLLPLLLLRRQAGPRGRSQQPSGCAPKASSSCLSRRTLSRIR